MSSQERTHFNTILNAMPDIMALSDADGRIVSVNAAWGRFARDNRSREEFQHGKDTDYFEALVEIGLGNEKLIQELRPAFKAIIDGARDSFEMEYPCHTPGDQRWYQVRVSVVPGESSRFALATHVDITRRKLAEMDLARETRKLREESLTDPLTQLRNRRALEIIGEQYWRQAQRTGGALGVLYLDLDDFKPINDNFGHKEGDRVLCTIADYLRGTFRDSDVIARVGGDEFVVLAWMRNREDLDKVAARLKTELKMTTEEGDEYIVSMSIGVAVHDPTEEGDLLSLMERADTAMYRHKKSRKVERR